MVKLFYYIKQSKLRLCVAIMFLIVVVFDLFVVGFNVAAFIKTNLNVTNLPASLTIVNIICAAVNIAFAVFFIVSFVLNRTKTLKTRKN